MSAYGLTETFGPSTIYIPQDPEDYPNATETERDAQLQVPSRSILASIVYLVQMFQQSDGRAMWGSFGCDRSTFCHLFLSNQCSSGRRAVLRPFG